MGHPLPRPDRSAAIDRALNDILSRRGVTAVAVVDGDGFVTHVRPDLDAEALGAAAQVAFHAATETARRAHQSRARRLVAENDEGVVVLTRLAGEFVLLVAADRTASLDALRADAEANELDRWL